MPAKETVVLLPVLLNGKPFVIGGGGDLAVTSDGRAVVLEDPIRSRSRFK